MKKMYFEGNQIHNFMSSSGSGTVINYGSSLKTYLLDLKTGRRIFGILIFAKNGENPSQNNFKITLKNFRCSDLPPFTVLYSI
jgi:hypothetical protein